MLIRKALNEFWWWWTAEAAVGQATPDCTTIPGQLLDGYAFANSDGWLTLDGTNDGKGQSFVSPATPREVTGVCFQLDKIGAPTGNMQAHIYAAAGVHGTNATPTGAALVSSATVAASLLRVGETDTVGFSFSGWTPAASTTYVVTLEHAAGDASNYVRIRADSSAPTHGGNSSNFISPTWSATAPDLVFLLRHVAASGSQAQASSRARWMFSNRGP